MAPNEDLAVVNAFVEELFHAGVRHVCISPGSRSTPLTIAVARHPSFQVWSLLDERSAGFFAFGLARLEQAPVALICTSGTATANYLPAVMEAHQSRVPLLLLTADRPPELHGVGANQTVDQQKLYGSHVKKFLQMPVPGNQQTLLHHARQAAWRAVLTAESSPKGPVHLNWPFREPLIPPQTAAQNPAASIHGQDQFKPVKPARGGLLSAQPAAQIPNSTVVKTVYHLTAKMSRGVIVCGPQDDPSVAQLILAFAHAFRLPVLADPLSQLRVSSASEAGVVVDTYDILFRDERWFERLQPDVIFRFGQTPTSKVLGRYLLAQSAAWQVVVDEDAGWADPFFTATHVVTGNPGHFCEAMLALQSQDAREEPDAAPAWLARWNGLNEQIHVATETALKSFDHSVMFEGQLPSELAAVLPAGTTVLVGNSMPVRDFDAFFYIPQHGIRLLGNRGVSGIDGVVSTALGMSAAGDGPVVLVIGDVSFYHDLNALMVAKRHRLPLVIVLVHNDGGGIFSFLPQAAYPETYEHFRTAHGVDFKPGVEMYGGNFRTVQDWQEFRQLLAEATSSQAGLSVIEIKTDTDANTGLHQEVFQHVLQTLEEEV